MWSSVLLSRLGGVSKPSARPDIWRIGGGGWYETARTGSGGISAVVGFSWKANGLEVRGANGWTGFETGVEAGIVAYLFCA